MNSSGHRYFIQTDDPLFSMVPLNPKSYGQLHEYFLFDISLGVGQNKIFRLVVYLSEDDQVAYGPDRHPY